VYHIDDEYTFSETTSFIAPDELKLIREADAVIIHSPQLAERKGTINDSTYVVPNGVDYDRFARRREPPRDLSAIRRPRVGYTGVIKKQLDIPLMRQLAERCSNWSFVLVGPLGNLSGVEAEFEALSTAPNVHVLGYRDAVDLAAYQQHFDVCIMPYRVNDYTDCIYPLKLHEYLASGKPVVASPIRTLRDFSHVISLATGVEEWVAAINSSFAEEALSDERVSVRRAIAAQHDWRALAARTAGIVASAVGGDVPKRVRDAQASIGAATSGVALDPLPVKGPGKIRERSLIAQSARRRPSYLFVLPWELHIVGGVNGVVRNLAKAMVEEGSLEPLIAVNSWKDSTPKQLADTLHFRFSAFGASSALGVIKAIVAAPIRLWRTFRLLNKYNTQAVNFHFPGIASIGVAVLKRLGVFRGKVILSYHGTDVAPASGRMESLIRSFVLRSADHLVTCSHGLAERMSSEFAIPVSRIDVVLNGVDASVFDGVGRPGTNLPGQLPSTFIVNVGSFIPRKNHALLLHAFALLKDRYPTLHLCIAGADGDERRAVEDEIRAHELSGRVHLFVDLNQFQVALLLSKATLCVQTSLAESFPLAVLEAGASGVPIAVSDIPGHQELVTNGRTGSLFPLGDPSACAEAIAAMLDDPNAAGRMATEQKVRVRKELTWVSSMQQYERMVRSTWRARR
jgi:glycosyltransferase involved in cell wall biosynthesis